MSDIIVKFRPDGEKRLVEAINKLQRATGNHTTIINKNTVATDKNRKSQSGLLKSQRLISGSFATMRSHLLLFNFAMGLGISQIVKFGKQAAKIDSMETAFNTLTGGVGSASIALDKLQEATNGTMSQFDLFQQANNAMILGVTKNSDEMAEMFDMAQRLGRALGRDTASSVESLITGIGRQSRLMLDNIGIIVKSDEAYQDYARSIGKTKDSLTDAEKKQAFMNATLESARKKLKTLGDETSSTQDSYDRLTASVADTGAEIGEVVNNAFIPLIDATTDFFDSLDTEKIRLLTELITTLGLTFAAFKVYALGAVVATRLLTAAKVALVASIGGLRFALGAFLSVLTSVSAVTFGWVTVIGSAIFALLRLTGVFGKSEKEADKLSGSVNEIQDAMDRTSTTNINQELQDFIDKMAEANQFLRFAANMIKTDIMEAFSEPLVKEAPFFGTETIKEAEAKIEKLGKQAAKFNKVWALIAQEKGAMDPEAQKKKALAQEAEAKIKKLKEKIANETKEIQDAVDSVNLTAFLEKFEEVTGISGDLFEVGEAEVFEASLGSIIKTEEEFAAVLKQVKDRQGALNEEAIQTIVNNVREKETLDKVTEAQKNNNNAGTKDKTIQDELQEAYSKTRDAQIALLDAKITAGEAAFWEGDLNDKELAGLNALIKKYNELVQAKQDDAKATTGMSQATLDFLGATSQNLGFVSNIANSFAQVGDMEKKNAQEVANIKYFGAIASTAAAGAQVLADPKLGLTGKILGMGAVLAQGYAQVRTIRDALSKMGGSTGDGGGGITDTTDAVVGQFAEGGYVGGRPHSQGGTIIEAERGEFVMSKNATESIGLETLNQMNKGGGAGNINISLSGNVLTRDFVEGELAESIKEAVRKGSDFGLS